MLSENQNVFCLLFNQGSNDLIVCAQIYGMEILNALR